MSSETVVSIFYCALCGFVTGFYGHTFPSVSYFVLNALCLGAFLIGRYFQ